MQVAAALPESASKAGACTRLQLKETLQVLPYVSFFHLTPTHTQLIPHWLPTSVVLLQEISPEARRAALMPEDGNAGCNVHTCHAECGLSRWTVMVRLYLGYQQSKGPGEGPGGLTPKIDYSR